MSIVVNKNSAIVSLSSMSLPAFRSLAPEIF